MEESFEEKQKHWRVAKPVCIVNTNTVKNASFTLNDVWRYRNLSFRFTVVVIKSRRLAGDKFHEIV